MASPSFSLEDFPFPALGADVESGLDAISALAFCSSAFLLALALALADVDKTAVGSFTVDVVVGTVVGLGYSKSESFA